MAFLTILIFITILCLFGYFITVKTKYFKHYRNFKKETIK